MLYPGYLLTPLKWHRAICILQQIVGTRLAALAFQKFGSHGRRGWPAGEGAAPEIHPDEEDFFEEDLLGKSMAAPKRYIYIYGSISFVK